MIGSTIMSYVAQAWPEEAGKDCDLHRGRPAACRLVEHPNKAIDEPWLSVLYLCSECRRAGFQRWAVEPEGAVDLVD
ncbi:MAG: hypothetical protein GEU28_04740 [Dehalococcoidia bacterium]|nr:hypothetical protein [Dehalococcoidia bacterium]